MHDFVSIGAAAPFRRPAPSRIAFLGITTAFAADYQARRDRFCGALTEVGFELSCPKAPTVMTGITAFGATDDVDFARFLVRDVGVATVPGSSFFHDKQLGR